MIICFLLTACIGDPANITIKQLLCSGFYAEWLNLPPGSKVQAVYLNQTIGNVKYFIMSCLWKRARNVGKMVKTIRGIAVHCDTFGHPGKLAVDRWPLAEKRTLFDQLTTNNEQRTTILWQE